MRKNAFKRAISLNLLKLNCQFFVNKKYFNF